MRYIFSFVIPSLLVTTLIVLYYLIFTDYSMKDFGEIPYMIVVFNLAIYLVSKLVLVLSNKKIEIRSLFVVNLILSILYAVTIFLYPFISKQNILNYVILLYLVIVTIFYYFFSFKNL